MKNNVQSMQNEELIGEGVGFERIRRITGYLVKKSDIEKLARGEAVQQDNVIWGLGEVNNSHILDRKVRSL